MVDAAKIGWVFVTVLLTLLSALFLNFGAKHLNATPAILFIIIATVIAINVAKLKLWGIIYRRYHLHESYPITALFFPMIYIVAIASGESTLSWHRIIGVVLIMTGIFLIGQKQREVR